MYSSKLELVKNMFCFALISQSENINRYYGSNESPAFFGWDEKKNQECQIKHFKYSNGTRSGDIFLCACFEDYCNLPISFRRFEANSYKLTV
ncbi:unnamed protein product [Caenorhabditis brenneri]